MKKYILFFVSIVLLFGTILIYNTINAEKDKEATFSQSGYILNNLSDRYYFYEGENYSKLYNDKIAFNDTEGEKVTVNNDNFIHYSNGDIQTLKESVLLDLNKIEENPILYYNVAAGQEIKKMSNRYSVKNLKSDIQFSQAIWKISDNKYSILSDNIKLMLNSGIEKQVEGYIEIEYSDNEVVNIYNQEINYQTISSDSYVELNDDIKINLGTKIVKKSDDNKMSLDNMAISSEDNLKLVDLKEDNEFNENTNENTNINETNDSRTSTSETTVSNSSTITGSDFTPTDIQYPTNTNEKTIDESKVLSEPMFKVESMEASAISMIAKIHITDDDDLLSKDDYIIAQIRNDVTGKIVESNSIEYGEMNFEVYNENLIPNTQYSLIISAKYILNETVYSKNFLYKTFATLDIGVNIEKNGFTDNSMNFVVNFSQDTLSKKATVKICNTEYQEIEGINPITINKDDKNKNISFTGLKSNMTYKVIIYDIEYDGAKRNVLGNDDPWVVEDEYITLKAKPNFNVNSYINKRNGSFDLYAENVTDIDNSIQFYEYSLHESTDIEDMESEASYTIKSQNTEESVKVSFDSNSDEKVKKEKSYRLKVIATMYDNEKYVEIEKFGNSFLMMPEKQCPTVEWKEISVSATSISGNINILDENSAIHLDKNISVQIQNSLGETLQPINYAECVRESDGKIVLNLNLKELKAKESYIFSVYATYDLGEKNENGDTDVRIDSFIGKIIVTTKEYENLRAIYKDVSSEHKDTAFTANLKLMTKNPTDTESLDNLKSLNLLLQAGSTYNGNNSTSIITITKDNYINYLEMAGDTTSTSFKEFVSENGINITPELIAGTGKEYNENYYIVGVTVTVDNTKYSNKIPLVAENTNEEIVSTIDYTDKKNSEVYKAAVVKIAGGDVETKDLNKAVAEKIINKDSSEKNVNLNDDTIVGYRVAAKFTSGNRATSSITYFAWNADGTAVYDQNGKQIKIEVQYNDPAKIPEAVFDLNNGDSRGKKGLYRGKAYKFSYEIKYANGEILSARENYSDIVNPLRQEPNIVMYPLISNVNETNSERGDVKYKYSSHDPDFVIQNEDDGLQFVLVGKSEMLKFNFDREAVNQEIDFKGLKKNEQYTNKYLSCMNSYSKNGEDTTEYVILGDVKFEENVQLNSENVGYYISYNENANCINITFSNKTSEDILSRVAAVDITFGTADREIKVGKRQLIVSTIDETKYYSVKLELSDDDLANLFGKEIQEINRAKIDFYYDNGIIGFNLGSGYVAYQNEEDQYLKLYGSTWNSADSIIGNIFQSNTEFSTTRVNLDLTTLSGEKAKRVLTYGKMDLKYDNDKNIIQKKIEISNIEKNINLSVKVIPKVKVTDMKVAFADITFRIGKVTSERLPNIIFEIYKLEEQEDGSYKVTGEPLEYSNVSFTAKNEDNTGVKYECKLDGLSPKTFYRMKIKEKVDGGKEQYLYDVDKNKVGYEYEFNTGAKIELNNININYSADKYSQRNLNIRYDIESGKYPLYDSTQYIICYKDEGGNDIEVYNKIVPNDKNALDKVTEIQKIDIGPCNNDSCFNTYEINGETKKYFIEFKKEYTLKIIPIVGIVGVLNTTEKTFELDPLLDIQNGAKAIRHDAGETGVYSFDRNTIGVNLTIIDSDSVIVDTGIDGIYTGIGKFKVKAYYLDESGNKQESIPIYTIDKTKSQIVESNLIDITNSVLNIQENSRNYPIYLYDVNFTRDCLVEYEMTVNLTNDPSNAVSKNIECCTVKKINNKANIDIGNYEISNRDINDNNFAINLNFYDSYHLNNVNLIYYNVSAYEDGKTVLKDASYINNSSLDLSKMTDNAQEISYYQLKLPFSLEKSKKYLIQIKLYNTDWNAEYSDIFERMSKSNFGSSIEFTYTYK